MATAYVTEIPSADMMTGFPIATGGVVTNDDGRALEERGKGGQASPDYALFRLACCRRLQRVVRPAVPMIQARRHAVPSTLETCTADQSPPRAVGIPRSFNPFAICRRLAVPSALIVSITGSRSAARRRARLFLSSSW